MNPLLKKEIRLVLPAWLAVLLLELCLPWLGKDQDTALSVAPVFFFFGMVLLAVDTFGREFSLGTFSSMMAQPVERGQIWRTKLSVLLVAAGLVFAAYFASCSLRLHLALIDGHSVWHANSKIITSDFSQAMMASGVVLFVALTGGLWTALLLRQVSAAFWIAFLAPAGLLMLLIFCLSLVFKSPSDFLAYGMVYGAAALYIVFAFWLAHRLMLRAEDAAWTGGIVSFAKWRYFESTAALRTSRRQLRPLAALLGKEFQLHSISLFGAAAILGLHIVVFFLRITYVKAHPNSLASTCSDCFWCFWLIIPLVIGCTAAAEERKLGVADSQFGLPVSRRRQYWIKLLPLMILGVLLGGVMPFLLETAASSFGAPSEFFKQDFHKESGSGDIWFPLSILASAAGLAWVGFFASTLARNFLQALSISIVSIVAYCFAAALVNYLGSNNISFFGLMPIPWILITLLGVPTLVVTYLWLGYRNFISYHESARLWRRNIVGLAGAVCLVVAVSTLIYSRVWEVLMPADLPHGTAQFSLAQPPVLQGNLNYENALQVRLPDGRVWCDNLGYRFGGNPQQHWRQLYDFLVHPLPFSLGPQAYIAGSNWVSTASFRSLYWDLPASRSAANYLDTVGIKADGTLWISSETRPLAWTGASMVRFGRETDWQQVIRSWTGLILLKTNGTLWRWEIKPHNWTQWQSAIRALPISQLGTNSDWREITSAEGGYAQKNDRSIWRFNTNGKTGEIKMEREPDLDPVVEQGISHSVYVGKDGILWAAGQRYFDHNEMQGGNFLRVGRETNWLAGGMVRNRLVALKSDGTLWQWDLSSALITDKTLLNPGTRLGSHNDWVALTSTWSGVITLAADGSLWLWPEIAPEQPTLMKTSKQPQRLGNVLAANQSE